MRDASKTKFDTLSRRGTRWGEGGKLFRSPTDARIHSSRAILFYFSNSKLFELATAQKRHEHKRTRNIKFNTRCTLIEREWSGGEELEQRNVGNIQRNPKVRVLEYCGLKKILERIKKNNE